MSLTYSIDTTRRRVIVVATAQPSFEEFERLNEAYMSDPAFEPGMDILWDRRAYPDAPSRDYIDRIAAWRQAHDRRLGGGRVATVVPGAVPAAYGMARMAELLAPSGARLRVFDSLDAATAWLDEPR